MPRFVDELGEDALCVSFGGKWCDGIPSNIPFSEAGVAHLLMAGILIN